MRLSESHRLPVPLAQAWHVLNDVASLRRALPACESFLEIAPDEFVAEMAVPLGLTTTHLTVYVHRREVDAPTHCALYFETRTERTGGDGGAVLTLSPDGPSSTTVVADITINIEGVIGVLGAPLIELAAHEMARQFFVGLRAIAVARQARARVA